MFQANKCKWWCFRPINVNGDALSHRHDLVQSGGLNWVIIGIGIIWDESISDRSCRGEPMTTGSLVQCLSHRNMIYILMYIYHVKV